MQKLLPIREFCRLYAISRSEAYRQAKAGRLRFTKIGKATRIAATDAEAWLTSLQQAEA